MSPRMRAFAGYAAVGAAVAAGGSAALAVWLGGEVDGAVWRAALLAYGVQLASFGALLRFRDRAFFAAWAGGTVLRLAAVVGAGLALARPATAAPLLLSLAGFLFVLLLLEPVFFRRASGRG